MSNLKTMIFGLLIITVLSVGLPIEPISNWAFEFTKYAGIDIPMTPLTSDMAMMSDFSGKTSYEKKLSLVVYSEGIRIQVDEKNLLFYKHKIPLHLFFEVIADGEMSEEGQHYVCSMLKEYAPKNKITAFELISNNKDKQNELMGFNKKRTCNE